MSRLLIASPRPALDVLGGSRPGPLSLTRVVASVGLIQVLAMVFTFGRSKAVAVTLGPSGVGTIGLIDQTISVVAQVCAFALPSAAVKFLSAAHSDNRGTFAELYAALFQALALLSVLGVAGVAAALGFWPAALGRGFLTYGGLVTLGLLAIPGINISVLLTSAIAAVRRARAAAVYGLLVTAATAGLAIAGVVVFGLRGYYAGSVLGASLAAAGGIVFLFRTEGLRLRWIPVRRWGWFRNVAGFSAALYLVSFTTPLADLIARLAVLRAGGLPTVGLFQAGVGMALALKTVIRGSFGIYFMPAINRNTDVKEKLRETAGFARALSIIIATIALPLVLFPGTWLSLLYSREFVQVSSYVWVFTFATVLQLFGATAQNLLTGLDHIGTFAMACLGGDVATAALSWWLVPRVGLYGVGIAMASNGSLLFVIGAWRVWSAHGLKLHTAVGRYVLAVLAAIAGAAVTAVLFSSNSAADTAGRLMAGLALWGVVLATARR